MKFLLFPVCLLTAQIVAAAPSAAPFPLSGTWTLQAADQLLPDGSRAHDYGDAPRGLLIVDAEGRYSLQIFSSERKRFASSDKSQASAGEFQSAVMGSSTHFGAIAIDAAKGTLTFSIEGASFPNWEGTRQERPYTLKDDVLSYQVPVRANGRTPISVWRRLR
ncbi:lipocalin-like domain-containing protein [Massilia endophytica]|uniref:lipocalin-like domain-containing protein n=1 Tax=Massilia endophytica TaxID=2899220 RepID=UPI001E451412|nr:lipocalin-like domain-containing protein [Massilia endophytica]UGQ48414.1 lipocalin-like domain-containing protein [Massilia endophytica]